jgi:hypothetical protein
MKAQELKTIDINAKEWFDKVNGNSYFAAVVTLNYGMANEEEIKLPFQYGYDRAAQHEAFTQLDKMGLINHEERSYSLKERGIIVRYSKQENCRKRDLINI